MYLRTASLSNNDSLLNYIYKNRNAMNDYSTQLASGVKLTKPSDDASAAISVLNANKQLDQLANYQSSIKSAQNEISTVDGTFASMIKSVQRCYDLTVQAANGTNSGTSLSAIKAEVDESIKTLTSLGNTKFNDKYVFSGTNTATSAYITEDDGSITYQGTPSGDETYKRQIEISDGVYETINVAGDSLLGSYDADTDSGTGIIGSLKKLSKALENEDYDTIRGCIDETLAGVNTISEARTRLGSVANRMDMTLDNITTNTTQLKSYRSGLQDVDYAEAASNYMTAQYALQTSLAVTAQSSQLSLMNYL